MSRKLFKWLLNCATVAFMPGLNVAISSELSNGYDTNFNNNIDTMQVYKYTDSNGKTTYASSVQDDFMEVEKMTLALPPSEKSADEVRQRHLKLKKAADELAEAREKREALREEKENKRLERLALINQSRPRVYERNVYVGYPYRLWRTYPPGGHHPHTSINLSASHRSSSRLSLPASSFSSSAH